MAQAIKETAAGLLVRGSKFVGMDVKNRAGEDLGDIEDVVIDFEAGRLAYVVLSFGSILGLGGKYFAIPPDALEFSATRDHVIFNIEKSVLDSAPGFDKDNWPDMADRTWGSKIYSYYGKEPYWRE